MLIRNLKKIIIITVRIIIIIVCKATHTHTQKPTMEIIWNLTLLHHLRKN